MPRDIRVAPSRLYEGSDDVGARILQEIPSLIVDGLRATSAAETIRGWDLSWLADDHGDGIELAPYRALLREVLQNHGPEVILKAGQSLRGVAHPILFVLLNSDSPILLVEKEQRLSRFIHTRHVVEVLEQHPRGIVLRHVSRAGAPEPTENLASAGQHIVLFEELGCRDLVLTIGKPTARRGDAVVAYSDSQFRSLGDLQRYDTWTFSWSDFVPSRKPMPGIDELLLASPGNRELEEGDDPVAIVRDTLRKDLGRTWKLDAVAREVGRSTRTLQRELSDAGSTFSSVVLQTRAGEAARLLKDTNLSVTEIGYVCGFADTAHFSRSFRKVYEASPTNWRTNLRTRS